VLLGIKEVREQRVCLVDKAQLERQVFLVFKEVQAQLAVKALQASQVEMVQLALQVLLVGREAQELLALRGFKEALALLELVLKAAQVLLG
jgi:hypothetical protein